MIKLAIVIPYYKLTYFDDTLESLSNQSDKRFKVYIGDDASPENPERLLEIYKDKFEFVYHRFNENLGGTSLAKQWERCIGLTNNEDWIMVLGDDDVLDKTVVASFYKNEKIFYNKTNVIRFATKKIFGSKVKEDDAFTHPIWEDAADAFYRKFNKTSRSSLSEYIFSKETFLKYGFYNYPLAWNSDDRAWLDFSDNKPIYTINESCVYFRISDYNISGKKDNILLKNKSEIQFYKFIVFNKLNYFNNEQKLRLLRRYQAELRRFRSLKISDFFVLLYFYLKYINIRWIQKFFKKIMNKLFNGKRKHGKS
ncbi:glycosyltransferase family 2 protein [Flavobacterium capsici]|uniref:Glycosyltransferase family 2 protein n=1 Tax=Flavobacterium capsici TaxID=3075618 RepID=A0AA96F097_9FLAO|nr:MULTISPECIES: glycosyltransferase family 2 protein [unclassified Flavobacterium]WNM20252.1 glycosyltransferase family 2 protein [Flavobacterium sp. PMR2A8]WNM21642.1 glycosyltransferase family 2 protein [Flavobacterium sp. PMTSA4]